MATKDVISSSHMYEYRIVPIIREVIKETGAELSDFKTTDDLLEYLWSSDIAKFFGQLVVDDMTDWTDDWLEQAKEHKE